MHETYLTDEVNRYGHSGQNGPRISVTPVTNKTECYAHIEQEKPKGRHNESKSHKMPREGHKLLLWKSVEKTPILQHINYKAIIKTVEIVEERISTA